MLDTILSWARSESAIEAVILTGSRARDDGSVDELNPDPLEAKFTAFARRLREGA
jgi:hypothetical protein